MLNSEEEEETWERMRRERKAKGVKELTNEDYEKGPYGEWFKKVMADLDEGRARMERDKQEKALLDAGDEGAQARWRARQDVFNEQLAVLMARIAREEAYEEEVQGTMARHAREAIERERKGRVEDMREGRHG